MIDVKPGDLLLTHSHSIFGEAIRWDESLRDKPNLANHVAIVHHTAPNGVVWTIQGQPGGVGWHVATDYLNDPYTMNNVNQPKTDEERDIICDGLEAMLGTHYDWEAIADDAFVSFGIPLHKAWDLLDGETLGHVVCSSLAQYRYMLAKLKCPPEQRLTTPADWLQLIIENRWSA